MKLLKAHLDIGLFTNQIAEQRAFWSDTIGLRFDHDIALGRGIVQYRYDAHGSVIKVNHLSTPLPVQRRTGYVGLTIASHDARRYEGLHPDGDAVRLLRSGTDGVTGIGITVRTPDPARMMRFYLGAMEFEQVGDHVARCGDSLLFVTEGEGGQESDDFVGVAFRYLTVQIQDADIALRDIVERGGRMARAPITLGTVARYGFVADPDGNWIEISARASLGAHVPADDR
jgi:lactoylglutathione lyase